MCLNNLMPILCFIFAARFCIVSAQKCGDSLYFIPNSTYDTNRRLVLSTLASNVGSRDGYYNISVGEGPESIYVMGLCIPGTEPKVCSDCIEGASVALIQKCPNETDSFQWRADKTLCFVRYSNQTFFDSMDLDPFELGIHSKNLSGNITEFNKIWEDLMSRMIKAASSSTSGSLAQRHYAASVTRWTDIQNIYTLMQCIPGITSVDCETCLKENVGTYQNCCNGKQGGAIQRPACIFRWDLYRYLGAFDDIMTPLPPSPQGLPLPPSPQGRPPMPPPPGGKHFPIWGIALIALPGLFVLGSIGCAVVYCTKNRKKKKKKSQSYRPMKSESIFGANPPIDGKVKPPNIQVFINFRGDQLRKNFISHLADALQRSEINVFIDNLERRGEDLKNLFKRIEDSGIVIVVFSSRYTESEWCLNELVKIKECADQCLLKVLPIFYKVTPENVKKLKGEFGDNFRDKEHKYVSEKPKIKRWREAIDVVSHKFGLTFDEKSSASENEFIEIIVKEVLKILKDISTVESGQSSR